jgi:hypothetical protein
VAGRKEIFSCKLVCKDEVSGSRRRDQVLSRAPKKSPAFGRIFLLIFICFIGE